ncbi:hypothetical protein PSGK_28355 [Pseudomonas solani]|uniref:hypothetical protein n=1 Tax=Pseudomonas TaxID=286 RepID=UPI000DA6DCD7|nr:MULTISPECIES: hypothetical protein [unclassified Pseudomonas]MDW3713707.1 hypothetical protein [Pseudomonas sp. 2023EL-01195]PZE14918.1 hypothetical protein DMX10_03025 [Pseudomonas sp. 57B-090624]
MASFRAALAIPLLLGCALLAGCESTHQYLIAEGYPPAFADGFRDGCSSGRQAAGVITGAFRKDVPRYLKERTYAEGWGDGFEQCKEQVRSEELREFHEQVSKDRDEDWERDKRRAMDRALTGH